MCKPKTPAPLKTPPPPKRGMEIPELKDLATLDSDEDNIKKKSKGLDALRINLNNIASSVPNGSAGLQVSS